MRHRLRLLRRARGGVPRGRTGRHVRGPQLDRLRAGRRRARGHAVELSALAGGPVRRPRAHGGQRRPPEAFAEHDGLRTGDPGPPDRGRCARRPVHRAGRRRARGPGHHPAAHRGPARRGGDHHRQRAGREGGRFGGGSGDQEVGAGTWRVRPVRGPGRRRPASRGGAGRAGAIPQRGPELHLTEAAGGRRDRGRGVHPATGRRGRGARRRRPGGARYRRRPDGTGRPPGRRPPAGRGVGRGRRAAAHRRHAAGRSRSLLRADGPLRRRPRSAGVRRGDLRSGRRGDRRRRRGRGRADRQRHPVRPRGERLDVGSGARCGRGPPDPLRRGLRERDRGVRRADALRRYPGQRLRPGAGGGRDPRVRERPHLVGPRRARHHRPTSE